MKNLQPAKYIEIRNEENKTVAFLSPQADGVRADTATINDGLNGNCTLSFDLPLTSDKWQYITDAHTFVVNGKHFILLKPDTEEIVRDGQKVWGKVTAQEKWIELDKKYATISNDPTMPQPKQWSDIIIVSGGSDLSGGHFPVGSAGHALCALLQGTGWTVETVDVTGTFDLESLGKESVLANIKKVQELWGGFLVWDSINKTVSLRSESTWQNYTGFQVRYAKNLKGITRTVNRNLVTRLYPFGKDDLNIGAVNGGVIYLENFTYTDKVYEGTYQNQDIADQTELKAKGIEELAKLCKPRYNYQVTMLDLSVKPEWAHETFSCGDMVDVIDDNVKANDRLRIVQHKYNVFQPWKCEIEVGEPLEKLANRIADNSKVAEKILANSGTSNILKGIINTKATEINGASGDYSLVDGVSTWWGSANGVRNGKVTRITPNGLIISDDGGQTWGLAVDGSGVYANKVVVSDVYALSTDDGYTKMGGSGISVMDANNVVKAFLGQYEPGKYGLKALDGLIEGLRAKWDLGAGTFRLGTSDIDFKLKFDGTDLVFSDDVRIQFKGDTGPQGAQGPQGPAGVDGSYYAPQWVKSTYIDFSQVASPKIIAGNAYLHDALIVGADGNNYAGISGVGTSADSVRFWAGNSDRNQAPFRVTQAGKLTVTGDITLDSLEGQQTSINLSGTKISGKSATRTYYELGTARTSLVDSRGGVLRCSTYIDGDDTRDCYLDITHNTIMAYQKLFAIYGQNKILLTDTALTTNFLNWSLGSSVNIKGNCSIGSNYYGSAAPANGCIIEGNVGIGTTSPSYKLHVEGQTKLNGNVGIGKNPTSYALDVQGNVLINGDLGVNGNVILTGTLSGDISANNGVSGTFKSSDSPAKTITVTNGIITGIA